MPIEIPCGMRVEVDRMLRETALDIAHATVYGLPVDPDLIRAYKDFVYLDSVLFAAEHNLSVVLVPDENGYLVRA